MSFNYFLNDDEHAALKHLVKCYRCEKIALFEKVYRLNESLSNRGVEYVCPAHRERELRHDIGLNEIASGESAYLLMPVAFTLNSLLKGFDFNLDAYLKGSA